MQSNDPFMRATVSQPVTGDDYEEPVVNRRRVRTLMRPFVDFDHSPEDFLKRIPIPSGLGKPNPLRSFGWIINGCAYKFKPSNNRIEIEEQCVDEESGTSIKLESVIIIDRLFSPELPHLSNLHIVARGPSGNRQHLIRDKIQERYEDGILTITDESVENP
jgi:hypothetical protein